MTLPKRQCTFFVLKVQWWEIQFASISRASPSRQAASTRRWAGPSLSRDAKRLPNTKTRPQTFCMRTASIRSIRSSYLRNAVTTTTICLPTSINDASCLPGASEIDSTRRYASHAARTRIRVSTCSIILPRPLTTSKTRLTSPPTRPHSAYRIGEGMHGRTTRVSSPIIDSTRIYTHRRLFRSLRAIRITAHAKTSLQRIRARRDFFLRSRAIEVYIWRYNTSGKQ